MGEFALKTVAGVRRGECRRANVASQRGSVGLAGRLLVIVSGAPGSQGIPRNIVWNRQEWITFARWSGTAIQLLQIMGLQRFGKE